MTFKVPKIFKVPTHLVLDINPGQDENPVVVGDDGRLGDEGVLPSPVVVRHRVAEGDALHTHLLTPGLDWRR